MASHRNDAGIGELKTYFTTVIDWIDSVFTAPPDPAMRGLDWGALYEEHHKTAYMADQIDARLQELLLDPAVNDRKGIYRYLLGGEKDPRLLNVRLFDGPTKKAAYASADQGSPGQGRLELPAVRHRRPTRTRPASTSSTRWRLTTSTPGRRVA
jgi:hypothetical protein